MNEYRRLLSDTLTFIKQNYAPGDSIFVASAPPKTLSSLPAEPTPAKVSNNKDVEGRLTVPKKQPAVIAAPPPATKKPAPPKEPEASPPEPLHLQPLEAPLIEKAEALRELLAKIAPGFVLKEAPPDDTHAQRVRNRWKEQTGAATVAFLSFSDNQKELQFYRNIAQAIDRCLLPAKWIDGRQLEKEKKWDLFLESPQLKWIIAPQDQLKKGMDILRHFRENPTTSEKHLGNASLLLIPSPSTYFKEPQLKRTLWETLCTRLSS